MAAVCLTFANCEKAKKQEKVEALVVENTVSTDREAMFLAYGGDYSWYETCVVYKDYLDEECDGTVNEVTNVFQVVKTDGESFDPYAILSHYTKDGHSQTVYHSFWLEDYPLNKEDINITFAEAYERIMQANYPKPHSRNCVLRKQVGACLANPQYIFGNTHAQLYVDAYTGKVSDVNPVFNN